MLLRDERHPARHQPPKGGIPICSCFRFTSPLRKSAAMDLAILRNVGMKDAFGVRGNRQVAFRVQADHCPFAAGGLQSAVDDRVGRLLDGIAFGFDQGINVMGGGEANEVLAHAGAGNRRAFVVGIGSGADDGESPTRPKCLFVKPPVDVPAARFPRSSTATAPTVPQCVFRG